MDAAKYGGDSAALTSADRSMLAFVEKLTLRPATVEETDVEELRGAGFDDGAILDIIQVVGLFSYYNRLADGVGIDLEPGMPAPGQRVCEPGRHPRSKPGPADL